MAAGLAPHDSPRLDLRKMHDMEMQALRAELEQLFELDDLIRLSEQLLGLDPTALGGEKAKGSYVKSLTEYCSRQDCLLALCDAVVATNPKASEQFRASANGSSRAPHWSADTQFAGFSIVRDLGEGASGRCYLAARDDAQFRLKVFHPACAADRGGLQRLLTFCRIVDQLGLPGIGSDVELGSAGHLHYVATRYVAGASAASHVARSGPIHVSDAAAWIRDLLVSLSRLHDRKLVHGDLKLENLLVLETPLTDAEGGAVSVQLQDAGTDRLRTFVDARGEAKLLCVSAPTTIAPEVLRGDGATPRSDLYAVGSMIYELLTGQSPFEGDCDVAQASAHLGEPPVAPSYAAPRGSVPFELEAFVMRLLSPHPDERPADAADALAAFDALMVTRAGATAISNEELGDRILALRDEPTDQEAALALESAADEGGDPARIAETFLEAFNLLAVDPESAEVRLDLGFRAGRLYRRAGATDLAEGVYTELLTLQPGNQVARAALEDLYLKTAKHDELIELWLGLTDSATSSAQKAELFAKIGSLYEQQLNDPSQAVVAFTQAFCDDPQNSDYAHAVERVASRNQAAWNDVLGSCADAASAGLGPDEHLAMLLQMGHWYADRLGRFDLALECYRNVLSHDAANDNALDGLAKLYRRSQQWGELADLLQRRSDAAATPAKGRDLRVEAAEILDKRLGDTARALAIYEAIIEEDPAHEAANGALAELYERSGDHAGYVRVLKRQSENLRGADRLSLLCAIGEAYEDKLSATSQALETYQSVTEEDPFNVSALRGLDRVYTKLGQFDRLLETLQAEVKAAATPRQKASLYERIASLYEEEFLDPRSAAEMMQRVLELDPRNENALVGLERIFKAQERWDELIELYGRHANQIDDPKRKGQLLFQRAKLLADQLGAPHQALVAFEAVLEVDSEHADALAALAELKQQSGDADEALRALDTLAESASTPAARADNYVRAARLLEKRKDWAGAADRYKLALDAIPHHGDASTGLRKTYLQLGDPHAAAELLHQQVELTESPTARGNLMAELARLAYEKLQDIELAEQAAHQALEWNDTSLDAREILGRIAMDQERYADAAVHFERSIAQLDSLPQDRALNVLIVYLDALARHGASEAALDAVQKLRELAPDNPEAMLRAAKVVFDHGEPEFARNLYTEILERFDDRLTAAERSLATFHHAEATRRTGQFGLAVSLLEEAAELDPTAPAPLRSLVQTHEAMEDWEETWEAQSRLLDLLEGDEKVQLLIAMGQLAMDKLQDRQRATRCLVAAVDVRPDDRRLLTRLMQLYSEDKDWAKAYDVVMKLAQFVEDPTQKARYLMTAGMICVREIGDQQTGLSVFAQVMELDPSLTKALEESIAIYREQGDFESAERLLKEKMRAASHAKDTARLLEAFTSLGELYRDDMNRPDDAVDAFEAAHTIDPDNRRRLDVLGQLYASHAHTYFDKAIAAYTNILEHDPYRADAYTALRKLYTERKNPDGAWLLCQALSVLKLAAPDEERFFKRMRSEDPAYAQEVVTAEDWARFLTHPEQDPLLTDIFAIIEPAVVVSRGYDFEQLGYDPRNTISPEHHNYPVGQTLHYAAGVLDMPTPPTFENTNDPGGLVFLDTKVPSISMGLGVLNAHLPPQMLAFICGHHLTYYRPGHFLRQLVGTGTGLKSWLFAAIKIISPTFPVAPDLEGAVSEAITTLQATLTPHAKDELARAVSKLLQASSALDLKKWVTAVDYTADRVGLVLAHDLETAVEVVQGSEGDAPGASQRRLKELVLFAISPHYLQLRERLGINLSI